MLDHDRCRCLGMDGDGRCLRADRCERHLTLLIDSPAEYHTCADRLCYSGYTFYIATEEPA